MKRFLFLLAIVAMLCGNAYADVVTATLGDKDTSNLYRLTAYRDSSQNGYLTYAPDTGVKYPYQESTTNLTLAAYQSGVIFGVYPSAGNTQYTLPTAVPGLDYYFVEGNAGNGWKVEIQSTDYIAFAGNTLGVGITNSSKAQGDEIELFCVFAGQWLIKDKLGTWSAGS